MITVNAAFGQEEKVLGMLGRIGENETRQIVFDCADILTEYPGAEIICVMQRHCDRTAYLSDAVLAGNVLTVTLTDADVSASGDLRIELRALVDGKIRKSAVYTGKVVSALRGEQDKPGNPTADVLNRIDMTISRAEESISEANAAAQSARKVANTVQTKLDNGDFVGPAGKDGKDGKQGPKGDTGATGPQGAPGSDASVTAENIQSALGYTPVKNVQMNGESLVQDSVATIPLAGYNRLGAVQLDPAGFAGASVDGMLSLVPPTDAQISTHTHTQRPITPSCMDYAVKTAMCDGKGAAWTDDEQKAARERMGVVGFAEMKHITTLVIAEETASIIVDLGKQCKICRFYYTFQEEISNGYTYVEVSNNNTEYYNMSGCSIGNIKYLDYIRIASALKPISIFAPINSIGNETTAKLEYSMPMRYAMDETAGFRYLKFTTYVINFPKNTTIEVYAV